MKIHIALTFYLINILDCNYLRAQEAFGGKNESNTQDSIDMKETIVPVYKDKEKVTLGGWIDAQYQYNQDDEDQSSLIQIRRARLDLKGTLSRMVDFRLQTDFAPNPRLIDAFVKVTFNKYVQVKVGQFKIPFSLENKLSPLNLEFTENAQVIKALSGYKDVTGISSYANGREIGVMLYGMLTSSNIGGEQVPILTYELGLFGGNGINIKTDNMAKDLSARLEFTPFVSGLNISVSGYWGYYDMLYNNLSTGIGGARCRMASGIEYKRNGIDVRGEYLYGTTDIAIPNQDPSAASVVATEAIFTDGFYVVGSYWFNMGVSKTGITRQKMRPTLRYDFYRHNTNASSEYPSIYYSAGIDWWPEEHLRMQLNYTLKQSQGLDKTGHNLTVMASVKF